MILFRASQGFTVAVLIPMAPRPIRHGLPYSPIPYHRPRLQRLPDWSGDDLGWSAPTLDLSVRTDLADVEDVRWNCALVATD
jgi:hypothetical protein